MSYYNELGYLNLLENIMKNGVTKSVFGNPGVFIKSLSGETLKFDLSDNKIPIYTSKKTAYKASFLEMLWFIKGIPNMKYLWDNNVSIWDEWFFKYTKDKLKNNDGFLSSIKNSISAFIENTDEKGLCNWFYKNTEDFHWDIPIHYTNMTNCDGINQLDWALDSIKKTPDRKSILVNYWNPLTTYAMADLSGNESVVLPACHVLHQVLINNGKLTLLVFIRSNDMFLGNPFNVSQYGMLAHMYSHLTGYPAEELIISIGDCHLYSNHFDQVKQQLTHKEELFEFPTIKFNPTKQYKSFSDFEISDIIIENYKSHERISADVTMVGGYK